MQAQKGDRTRLKWQPRKITTLSHGSQTASMQGRDGTTEKREGKTSVVTSERGYVAAAPEELKHA